MSEPNVVEKLKKEVIGYFDNFLTDIEKKKKLIEKSKDEILKRKGDLQDVLDMFTKYGIEIVDYKKVNNHFNELPEYTGIKPYAAILFAVKHPDNNVILNIKARYTCYICSKKHIYSGYELDLSNNGCEAVNEKSIRAKSIKECINIFKNKHKLYSFPMVEIGPRADKITEEFFFHIVNSLLSLKTMDDIKKFKNFTSLEIVESNEVLNSANSLNRKSASSKMVVFR